MPVEHLNLNKIRREIPLLSSGVKYLTLSPKNGTIFGIYL